jgi:hypothetical protein
MSRALGHLSNASPAASFVDVVKGKGKAPIDVKGKAPLDPVASSAPWSGESVGQRPVSHSFMVDAPRPPASHSKPAAGGQRAVAAHRS